ncbi:DUF6082 family protein [Actinomycetota bacterium Odt1-20B]
MATQKYRIRGTGSAAVAGLAFAVGALALLLDRQRRHHEQLRLRLDDMERTERRPAELPQQQQLQFYLLSKAMDDPDLAAVLSTVEAPPTKRRQYLFANALYTNAVHAFRIGIVNWEELHGHLRVICRNPIFREYWEATRHHRASLEDSSDEARVGRMMDGLIHDLDDPDADEWWVIGEPPPE